MTAPKEKKEKLILLDSHAILHRAYHALPEFSSSKGEPTGAIYGLATMLIKIINDLKPDYIVACYDLPEPTYRHDVYKDYKAGRKKIDDNLVSQIIRSRDLFAAFGIPLYEKAGFEADDMLGTIVEEMKNNKAVDIVIASGDMDTLQLVDDKRVQVYTLKRGIADTILYDEDGVVKRFGFGPDLLPDYKGLRGDPSDNIIGIKGIGEKTATDLIVSFGTIENLYIVLKKDRTLLLKKGIKERIVTLLETNEEEALFSKMLAQIRHDAPIEFELPKKRWAEALEISKVTELFAELEFRTLGARVRELFGQPALLTEISEEKPVENVGTEELHKIAIALWVLDSSIASPQLDDILQFAKAKDFAEAKQVILSEIKKRNLEKVYEDIELPLISILQKMHECGIAIDTKYLHKLSKEYHKELSRYEEQIWKHAGKEFNINSPKQLGEILFDTLKLTIKNHKKTSLGVKSTRESELEKLKGTHPIIDDILEYRQLQKLLSTYIDTIPHMVDEKGRLHTTFVQTGSSTGRMSSQNPNLQNIPIKTELGRNIRKGFVAEKGWKLVSFDYSQIELRVAAILSGDEKLGAVFKSGGDVHTAVASEVFKVAPTDVTKEMRRQAKVINFGVLYGMGVNALRQNLGADTDRAEAQRFYNEYFSGFSGLATYLEKIKKIAAQQGYTETLFGRRRYFEGINSHLPHIKASAERMAINAPIQGTSADILKIAMIRIAGYLKEKKQENNAHLLLQVHDELVFEIREEKVAELAAPIRKIMESVLSLEESRGIPLVSSCASGDSWATLNEID